ncbi:hypothetical protein FIBSPDRAFT_862726 [Athelia psychrophila]|uniref:Uncharacterized protein n=1 Tax=Athelia psychrophila TaxID=1759441 RepID=A0A166HXB5_9AGAM|nr:hypothetical protein FIBSPDRAFT_862726 [Fibularhizoctonia sp. CBS 109695]
MASDYRLGHRGGRGDWGKSFEPSSACRPSFRGAEELSVALLVLSFSYARVEAMWETNPFAMG